MELKKLYYMKLPGKGKQLYEQINDLTRGFWQRRAFESRILYDTSCKRNAALFDVLREERKMLSPFGKR